MTREEAREWFASDGCNVGTMAPRLSLYDPLHPASQTN